MLLNTLIASVCPLIAATCNGVFLEGETTTKQKQVLLRAAVEGCGWGEAGAVTVRCRRLPT